MSDREKKLLALFLLAGFVIVNVFLFSFYSQKRDLYANDLNTAKSKLQQAIAFSESSDQLADQMEWLAQHEPQPSAYQDVENALQSFTETQARSMGLNIRRQEILPTDETGVRYHIAQVRFDVTGPEQALYRWLDAVNDPASFRTARTISSRPP